MPSPSESAFFCATGGLGVTVFIAGATIGCGGGVATTGGKVGSGSLFTTGFSVLGFASSCFDRISGVARFSLPPNRYSKPSCRYWMSESNEINSPRNPKLLEVANSAPSPNSTCTSFCCTTLTSPETDNMPMPVRRNALIPRR